MFILDRYYGFSDCRKCECPDTSIVMKVRNKEELQDRDYGDHLSTEQFLIILASYGEYAGDPISNDEL